VLELRPITLKEANAFVGAVHRHHGPAVGHKFSIGVAKDDKLVGVAICGRPVARGSDNGVTAEVTRLATDGTRNACSALYSACARAAKAMGYCHIQTYILETEPGTSLRAAGWVKEAETAGGAWKYTGQKRNNDHPLCRKHRYGRALRRVTLGRNMPKTDAKPGNEDGAAE